MKKVLTFGVFDYFHLGHLRLFKQCKNYGDFLIVAIQNNDYILKFKPNSKLMYSTEERVEMIEALTIVNQTIVYNSVDNVTLETIDFDILALGEDHTGKRFDEVIEWCNGNNKEVIRMKRTPSICSTSIKANI